MKNYVVIMEDEKVKWQKNNINSYQLFSYLLKTRTTLKLRLTYELSTDNCLY